MKRENPGLTFALPFLVTEFAAAAVTHTHTHTHSSIYLSRSSFLQLRTYLTLLGLLHLWGWERGCFGGIFEFKGANHILKWIGLPTTYD